MFNWLKKKEIIDEPPDEPNGKVEFCNPIIPREVFKESNSVDSFINKINKKDE